MVDCIHLGLNKFLVGEEFEEGGARRGGQEQKEASRYEGSQGEDDGGERAKGGIVGGGVAAVWSVSNLRSRTGNAE